VGGEASCVVKVHPPPGELSKKSLADLPHKGGGENQDPQKKNARSFGRIVHSSPCGEVTAKQAGGG